MATARRIDLGWGGGKFDVLLDYRNMRLYPYSDVDRVSKLHTWYGGKLYYTSHTGLTGAGWIDNLPTVEKVSTYRVDCSCCEIPPASRWSGNICVPIDYKEGKIPTDWPVLISTDQGRVICADHESVGPAILQEHGDGRVDFDFDIIKRSGQRVPTSMHYDVEIFGRPHNLRKVVEAVYYQELKFSWPEDWYVSHPYHDYFWQRLGLWRLEVDYVYKVVRGICRGVYKLPTTVEDLQKISPKNVMVIEPRFYLCRESWRYEANAEIQIDDETYHQTRVVNRPLAIRAMNGDYAELLSLLEADARELHLRLLQQKKEPQELYGAYGDMIVTMREAAVATNCPTGVRSFRDRYFPDRESVTIRELFPWIMKDPNVRKVVDFRVGLANNTPRVEVKYDGSH